MNIDSISRSENTASVAEAADRLTRHGITIRREKLADGRWGKWKTVIRFKNKRHWLTLTETAKDSFDIAIRARRELHAGRWTDLKASTALRQINQTTLSQVFAKYREFIGPDRPLETTRDLNINALTAILREAFTDPQLDVESLSLLRLNAELIWKWKEQKRQLAARETETGNDERALQILRSANSRLRQARSIFSDSDDLRAFYRFHKIALPDCIKAFCEEPPFGGCSKDQYNPPIDEIINRTLHALEKLGESNNPDELNMFKACWLTIGFGLRKSEISKACKHWFETVDGVVFIRGDRLSKNGKFPIVRVQLSAWERLEPKFRHLKDEDFVLTGSQTDRCENTFRAVSEWMRSLGWATTHHIHELRAWAGCQIAMAPGNDIRSAQVFLRHASFGTTEKFYGHHLKVKLNEVKLTMPEVKPKQFIPVVLPVAQGS